MPYAHLRSTDSVDTMIVRLKNMGPLLPIMIGEYSDGYLNDHKIWKKNTATATNDFIYGDSDDHIILAYHLRSLAESIEAILLHAKINATVYEKFEADSKRVLLATYNAILCPTTQHCNDLQKIANNVSGHGDIWVKVGIILGTIVGLLLGVIPGVAFAGYHYGEKTWEKNSPQGLSLHAATMCNAIKETKGYAFIQKQTQWAFFSPRRDQLIADAARIIINSVEPCQSNLVMSPVSNFNIVMGQDYCSTIATAPL